MFGTRSIYRILPALSIVVTLCGLLAAAAVSDAAPVKLVLGPARLGSEVKEVTVGCEGAKGAECEAGELSTAAGGFAFPQGAAVAPNGDVYVADTVNHRVQRFDAQGHFILMFGARVDKETGDNTCLSKEASVCTAGATGLKAGELGASELSEPASVAVEPSTEDVYVLDRSNARVEKFGPNGEFLLMIGKEVNKKGGSVCKATEISQCQAGVFGGLESKEVSFNVQQFTGNLLAMGESAEHTLFVGDAHRIEEFGPEGETKGEIRLSSTTIDVSPERHITSVAAAKGTLYAVYNSYPAIYKFEIAKGTEEGLLAVTREGKVTGKLMVTTVGLDSSDHLAVTMAEELPGSTPQFGQLYQASSGKPITSFVVPGLQELHGVHDVAFAPSGLMYSMVTTDQDIAIYEPKPVAELTTLSELCNSGPEHETDVTFNCDLRGDVDPWGVPGTEVWFQWGRSISLGNETPAQPIRKQKEPPVEGEEEPLDPVAATVEGVRPNESFFYYRIVGIDANIHLPELLTGEILSFATPVAPPKIVDRPVERFVTSTSAVFFGELNPENDATTYEFQYARYDETTCPNLESCSEVLKTAPLTSNAYRRLGATGGASGLRPGTEYLYRLYAENAAGLAVNEVGEPQLPEGRFKTLAAPQVLAATGSAASITATGAVISGSVDPDGQAATYNFELGIDAGPNTHYSVVSYRPTGPVSGFESESQQLNGLLPGTKYAYRIAVHFGDGTSPGSSATGAALTFETPGVAPMFSPDASVPMLKVPEIEVPTIATEPTREELLAHALKACKSRPRRKRPSCERQARKRYGVTNKGKKKKKKRSSKA